VLYAGCVLFGASVGNLITIPPLIVQREFPSAIFGLVIGLSSAIGQFAYSLAPALLGAVRDATGSYTAVLATCIALQLAAALIVLMPARPALAT
jgi:nitrate/nitrite transporter NarK